MKSEIIQAVFKDELERTKRLISRYEKEAEKLPKGSIYARKIANQEYFYLSYRDGKKTVSKFLGNANTFDKSELLKKTERRRELQRLIKKLKSDQKQFEKFLSPIYYILAIIVIFANM